MTQVGDQAGADDGGGAVGSLLSRQCPLPQNLSVRVFSGASM